MVYFINKNGDAKQQHCWNFYGEKFSKKYLRLISASTVNNFKWLGERSETTYDGISAGAEENIDLDRASIAEESILSISRRS